ncbi:restriction endonuclease subunit S [Hymenobacter sp. DG01]|uniref:restriction endonuclease subunit S n=1 Tax=Hymenobacter sp. DG01 TaxID=2584940 RepID=UPI0011212507|nr:restriction endonuclease subunit S [Hymenobacter sp. DG01]
MKSNLPAGWAWSTLDELSVKISDGSHNPPKGKEAGIPMLSAKNIQDNIIHFDDARLISEEDYQSEVSRVNISAGDVLLTIVGTIGRTAVVADGLPKFSLQRSVAIIKPRIDSKFLAYCLRSPLIQKYLSDNAKGTAQKGIYLNALKKIPVCLPPAAEQARIVEQLEATMQKLEASQERLEKLPELLKKFRQAVLAAAVSGKLTEAWRAEQVDLESAEQLVEQIIEVRKTRFAQASALAKAEGRKTPRRVFAEEAPTIGSALLPELPDSWTASTVGFLAHVTKLAGFEYTNYIKYEEQGDIPVVRAQNVQMGRFVEDNLLYIDLATSDFLERSQLHGREVLMVFIGAGTGNVCLAPKDRRWHLAPNVAKIDCDVISPEYLNFYLQSPTGLRNTLSFAKATAQPSLSMETIREIAVALPGLAEQQEIVRQVNHYFELADQLEARFEQAASLVEQLPQALLAKAFSGQLVPQDPNDEPASVLLERLEAGVAAPVKGKRGRKPKAVADAPLFE